MKMIDYQGVTNSDCDASGFSCVNPRCSETYCDEAAHPERYAAPASKECYKPNGMLPDKPWHWTKRWTLR